MKSQRHGPEGESSGTPQLRITPDARRPLPLVKHVQRLPANAGNTRMKRDCKRRTKERVIKGRRWQEREWRGERHERANARHVWERQRSQQRDECRKHGGERLAEGVNLRKSARGNTQRLGEEEQDSGTSAYRT